MRVRVKICGITTVEDGLAAAEAGADAVGLNFAEGPRLIDGGTARAIVAALPPYVTPVALFVNADASRIVETCARVGVSAVQLSGDEPPDLIAALAPLRALRAFRVSREDDLAAVSAYLDACPAACRPSAVLLDARVAGMHGGTGRSFDWTLAAKASDLARVVLAGGLGPDNVAEAIRTCRPWAVDTSSRLESSPGRKDARLMTAFVAAVREAERQTE